MSTTASTKKPHPAVIQADYEGVPFKFREDGYFSMSDAAKKMGRRLDPFWRAAETSAYLDALAECLSSNTTEMCDLGLVQSKRGNGGGTWAHPKLAVFFARWLDVRFSVWCDMTIDSILKGKLEVAPAKGHEQDPEVAKLVAVVDALKAQVAVNP